MEEGTLIAVIGHRKQQVEDSIIQEKVNKIFLFQNLLNQWAYDFRPMSGKRSWSLEGPIIYIYQKQFWFLMNNSNLVSVSCEDLNLQDL